MAGKNIKSEIIFPVRLCVTLWLIVFLVSCQTTPHIPDILLEEAQFAPLESGGSVYVFANARQARPIIDLLPIEELNDRQARQILERTDFFTAALFPPASGRRFQLAARGNYPSTRGFFALNTNRHWKRQRFAGGSYWYSEANRLSLMMTSTQVFITSFYNNIPAEPVTVPGTRIPEGFHEFRRGYPFSCWLENPAPIFARILSDAGLPIRFPVQQLFFNLYPVERERYEAIIRMQFENALQARGMAAIFNLASGFTPNESNSIIASIFFSNPPVQNGSSLDIRTAVLSETDITRLLYLFMF